MVCRENTKAPMKMAKVFRHRWEILWKRIFEKYLTFFLIVYYQERAKTHRTTGAFDNVDIKRVCEEIVPEKSMKKGFDFYALWGYYLMFEEPQVVIDLISLPHKSM